MIIGYSRVFGGTTPVLPSTIEWVNDNTNYLLSRNGQKNEKTTGQGTDHDNSDIVITDGMDPFYCEITTIGTTSSSFFGIEAGTTSLTTYPGAVNGIGSYAGNGSVYVNGAVVGNIGSWSSGGKVMGIAVRNNKVYLRQANGIWNGDPVNETGSLFTITTFPSSISLSLYQPGDSAFLNEVAVYSVPSGFTFIPGPDPGVTCQADTEQTSGTADTSFAYDSRAVGQGFIPLYSGRVCQITLHPVVNLAAAAVELRFAPTTNLGSDYVNFSVPHTDLIAGSDYVLDIPLEKEIMVTQSVAHYFGILNNGGWNNRIEFLDEADSYAGETSYRADSFWNMNVSNTDDFYFGIRIER